MKPLSLIIAMLLPQVSLAHPGDHGLATATHLLTEADHLAVIGVVLVVAAGSWIWRRGR